METLITFDEKQKVFHLSNSQISYLFSVEAGATLSHLYFGQAVKAYHGQLRYPRLDRGFSGNLPGSKDRTFSRDSVPEEYSSAGEMNFRTLASVVRQADGANALMLKYVGYEITPGKPKLTGLPAAYVENDDEAQTLTVTLQDEKSQVEFKLAYTIYRDYPIITRSVQVVNHGEAKVKLEKVASMQLDFVGRDLDVISLPGAHVRERQITRTRVTPGIHQYSSIRGSSSHQMNPFVALVDPATTEFSGEAYGFALVYSGNHAFEVEKDQFGQTRLTAGINDFNFNWELQPGASFQAPEVLLTYSSHGLNGMSQGFHHLIQERVVRSKFKHAQRPIVVNNWEATYFDFDEAKLQTIVDEAQNLGIEMFVLDDGWFGHRSNDDSSLGDWQVFAKKFPHGLKHFADYVHGKGLKFGLWFEPEMISYDSDLYRNHPDYLMQVPGREPSPARDQYILDLSRQEVVDNIFEQVKAILTANDVDYVKWDMNRHLSDIYSVGLPPERQGEVYHRYMLGVYQLMDRLTSAFPDVLFEGCSGGGGRFDAGLAYYMPQSWTSDNTDAVARLGTQAGTSLVYPPSLMTAHVSAVPNGQTGRTTSFATRGAVAMSAVFGYELDLTKLTTEEKQAVKEQIGKYQEVRDLVVNGDFFRLKDPGAGNEVAWMFVAKDQSEALVMDCQLLAEAQPFFTKTKLVGLDPNRKYQNVATKEIFGGDELMHLGYYNPVVKEDFVARLTHFKAL